MAVKYADDVVGSYKLYRRFVMRVGTGMNIRLPGQGEDGYGGKITTDMVLKFDANPKTVYRVYATCYSNAASHWITVNGEVLHLRSHNKSEILNEEEPTPTSPLKTAKHKPEPAYRKGKAGRYLGDIESLKWLAEVHNVAAEGYRAAILYGNEDCPDAVELYAKDDYRCKPTVYVYNEETSTLILLQWGQKPDPKFLADRPTTEAENNTHKGEA